jgi:hypothetical protein
MRFGRDVRSGAVQAATADAFDVILEPERRDVQRAWAETLADLDALQGTCRELDVPLLLVAFPYGIQLYQPELRSPQETLERWAEKSAVPFVDLQPVFLAAVQRGVRVEDLMIDPVHPQALGHALVADAVADAVVQSGAVERR